MLVTKELNARILKIATGCLPSSCGDAPRPAEMVNVIAPDSAARIVGRSFSNYAVPVTRSDVDSRTPRNNRRIECN